MDLDISELQPADFDEVLALCQAQGRADIPVNSPAGMAAMLHGNACLSLVVRVDGKVVAAALCGRWEGGREMHLVRAAGSSPQLDDALIHRSLQKLSARGIRKCRVHASTACTRQADPLTGFRWDALASGAP